MVYASKKIKTENGYSFINNAKHIKALFMKQNNIETNRPPRMA